MFHPREAQGKRQRRWRLAALLARRIFNFNILLARVLPAIHKRHSRFPRVSHSKKKYFFSNAKRKEEGYAFLLRAPREYLEVP
ncbi:MAG: hypothetical protein ACOY3I_10300, partial [Verrucomicrobiota bacterium]